MLDTQLTKRSVRHFLGIKMSGFMLSNKENKEHCPKFIKLSRDILRSVDGTK